LFATAPAQPSPGRRRYWAALAASALLHAGLLAWFGLRARNVAGPEAPIGVVFLQSPLAAPPPEPAPSPAERAARRQRQAYLDRLVQPTAVPEPRRGPAPAGSAASAGEDDAPAEAGGNTTRPILVTRVKPDYTRAAQMAGLEGDVVLEAVIDERGRVTALRVLRGLDPGLDQAALDAVRRWRFKPALRNGKPVKVFYILTVHYRL
jgi:protein TonB